MIEKRFLMAKEIYKEYGVDVDKALDMLAKIPISIHCWQGDDVKGFISEAETSGGIQITGDYVGRATDANELRKDLNLALNLIPGKHRINLHSIYAESDEQIDISEIKPNHFSNWIKWAKEHQLGIDFNPTLFSHSMAKDGLTLSHPNKDIREFWINHVKNTREIASYIASELNQSCIHNLWIPDGYKDYPYSRLEIREHYLNSLNEIFDKKYDNVIDTVESKLFGLGVEGFTVGSHEFYLAYAIKNEIGLCLDSGHFHPTETISDKLSAISPFVSNILLHVSRPMRWDSDHVVLMDDELQNIANAIIRDNLLDKVHIGLDFFDASINRIAAWVIGVRNTQKSLLKAMLEPTDQLKKIERELDFSKRMYLTEELKTLPFGIVFDYYCHINKVPIGKEFYQHIKEYEDHELRRRS